MTIIEVHAKAHNQTDNENTEFVLTREIVIAKMKELKIHEHVNTELIRALSEKLGVTRQHISIHSGHNAFIKMVKIDSAKTKEQIFASF